MRTLVPVEYAVSSSSAVALADCAFLDLFAMAFMVMRSVIPGCLIYLYIVGDGGAGLAPLGPWTPFTPRALCAQQGTAIVGTLGG